SCVLVCAVRPAAEPGESGQGVHYPIGAESRHSSDRSVIGHEKVAERVERNAPGPVEPCRAICAIGGASLAGFSRNSAKSVELRTRIRGKEKRDARGNEKRHNCFHPRMRIEQFSICEAIETLEHQRDMV